MCAGLRGPEVTGALEDVVRHAPGTLEDECEAVVQPVATVEEETVARSPSTGSVSAQGAPWATKEIEHPARPRVKMNQQW